MGGQIGDHNLDLPFEESPMTDMADVDDAVIVGGMVVMAAVVPVDGLGPKPALVFRFVLPDGSFLKPVVFVADDDQLAKARPLVDQAIAAARRGATIAAAEGTQ